MSLISASGFSPSCSEILKGFVGIGPLYGLSWNPFIHFFSCSPANVLSWYDSLNSRTSMVRFLGIVASSACSTCVSKILTLVYLFRIPSHFLAGVYLQTPFASFAPALTVVSWLSGVLLVRTTLPVGSSRTPFHSGIPSLGFLNSESGTQSAWPLPDRMLTGTGLCIYWYCRLFAMPIAHSATLCPSPYGSHWQFFGEYSTVCLAGWFV